MHVVCRCAREPPGGPRLDPDNPRAGWFVKDRKGDENEEAKAEHDEDPAPVPEVDPAGPAAIVVKSVRVPAIVAVASVAVVIRRSIIVIIVEVASAIIFPVQTAPVRHLRPFEG